MRVETVNGAELTIGDIVEWQDLETNVLHSGFLTPFGHPYAGYMVISETHPWISLNSIAGNPTLKKVGEVADA